MDIPENFHKNIMDMTEDLTRTFPEYSDLWCRWTTKHFHLMDKTSTEIEVKVLYDYIVSVYPERFFDIIYQNEDIFVMTNNVNTFFLPGIDFKILFNCNGISEQTRKVMWNYLKLILLTVVGGVTDKSRFGAAGSQFDGIEESELLEKLRETMVGMTDFFQTLNPDSDKNKSRNENTSTEETPILPKVDDIFGHLKSLFDGKIGSLAKELAEEISGQFSDIFCQEELGEINTTKDVINKLLTNPAKMSGLLKTINEKLQSKISSGAISQDELMTEVIELMEKMKKGGSGFDFQELFKNMGGAGGIGEMFKTPHKAEAPLNPFQKMKNRAILRKAKEAESKLAAQKKIIESTEKPHYSFTVDEIEKQSQSSILSAPAQKQQPSNNKKNKKNKKNKNL